MTQSADARMHDLSDADLGSSDEGTVGTKDGPPHISVKEGNWTAGLEQMEGTQHALHQQWVAEGLKRTESTLVHLTTKKSFDH